MAKTQLKDAAAMRYQRSGLSPSGSPTNLNLVRTMRHSLARRISLRRPKREVLAEVAARIAEIEAAEGDRTAEAEGQLIQLRTRLAELESRSKRIGYIDPVDLRYNRFEPKPQPNSQAVMFCLMDVSGSMTEERKDLAKRFFLLLHLFLTRKYEHVDIIFIRHTTEAKEVDEETFFRSRETGGTIVSTALAEMKRVVEDRYPVDEWNIYAAQASDGDNYSSDSAACIQLLRDEILPICQYFAYIEVLDERESEMFHAIANVSDLWKSYATLSDTAANFAMRRVFSKSDVFPVFHRLFAKTRSAA